MRTFDLLARYLSKFEDKTDVFASKVNGNWKTYSVDDYVSQSNYISSGLIELGFKKRDKIATITNNRPEWNFVDMGLAQTGLIHVPVFTNLSEKGYKEIFEHSEVKAVFVSDLKLYNTVSKITSVPIFTFNQIDGGKHWSELAELGRKNYETNKPILDQIKNEINADDPVTLIYTSGTTGNSKGVLLSHSNLMSNAISVAEVIQLKPEHRYLSILPICHVGERMGSYQTQYSGCSIYYAQNIGTIAADLKEVKPHGFGAVPRILEKVYDKIIAKGNKLGGVKKKLFFWALHLGLNYKINGENGWWYEFQLNLANKLVFSKWREAMGGNVVSIGIGGAALQPRLERVFWAAGIKLLNMYGLTETSPVITINRPESPELRLGTVGSVIENVEVRIADDGEILCKGSNVMLGYFKDEEATKQAIDLEGWFHTGDVGVLEEGKFLRITDRKKEIFKLSNGKYVSPLSIENQFKESIYIDQLMVIGESQKFASALISPNFEEIVEWAKKFGISYQSNSDLINDDRVLHHYNSIIKILNQSLNSDEKIKRFRLIPDTWTPESGELSPTLKLKRRIILEKYRVIIEKIFNQ